VLSLRAATDPEHLKTTIAAADTSNLLVPGYAQRPVYSSIVRELGAALDVAGGFGARTTAGRALLTAYLSQEVEHGAGSFGRTVSGFREWRSQLSGNSFRRGQLDTAAALAEAFTEVVLNASRAAPPAQELHGLLVRSARSLPPSGTVATRRRAVNATARRST
jgi:hypothetical protein